MMSSRSNRSAQDSESTRANARQWVVLIGASVRAAAESIVRINPAANLIGIDFFGDVDTRVFCKHWFDLRQIHPQSIRKIDALNPAYLIGVGGGFKPDGEQWSHSLPRAIRVNFEDDPSIEVVDRWARRCGLLVPHFVHEPFLGDESSWRDGQYLSKPIRGCGGLAIRRITKRQRSVHSDAVIVQKFVAGIPVGVSFVIDDKRAVYVGASQSLVHQVDDQPFLYAGSIGPISLGIHRAAILKLGQTVASELLSVRCFNIDLVIDGEHCWVLEVNARYSASMEIYERLMERSILWPPKSSQWESTEQQFDAAIEKRIVYAKKSWRFSLDTVLRDNPGFVVADYPADGTVIQRGEPTCTLITKLLN